MKNIRLIDIYKSLSEIGITCCIFGDVNTIISGLSFDTRDLENGMLFFCKGVHFKEEYLKNAIEKGARAYISEKKYDVDLPCIITDNIRRSMSIAAKCVYGEKANNVSLIGITGTNGKTTTTYYIKNILDKYLGFETAILSSNETYDGLKKETAHLTTPESIAIFRHIANASDCNIPYLEMEVSSQALKYDRVCDLNYKAVIFSNIDNDHISPNEHCDFDDYYKSKLKIFDNAEIAAVNVDDEHSNKTLEYAYAKCKKVVKYGSSPDCDVKLIDYSLVNGGISFNVSVYGKTENFVITMPGIFNISNALATISVCVNLGVPCEIIREGLLNARAAGRMEVFSSDDGRVTAIVDYAHNKMSFTTLYNAVHYQYPDKKIIAVFGCAGNKAFDRRHDLPDIAGHQADFCIITDDDSGEEGFEHVASTIEPNIKATGCPYLIIENRDEAVRKAILEQGQDIVVVITGKGIETTQKHGLGYIDVPSDIESSKKYIAEYNSLCGGKN